MTCVPILFCLTMGSASGSPDMLLSVRRYVAEWLRGIPNFVCEQSTEVSTSGQSHRAWRPEPKFLLELTVDGGVEHYRLEDPSRVHHLPSSEFGVLSSRGEFLSAVRALFDPKSQAVFEKSHLVHTENGGTLQRLNFYIRHKNSEWYIGEPEYAPAYSGSISVDPMDGSIIQLEMETGGLPDRLPIKKVSVQLTFSLVEAGEAHYRLPREAVVTVCTKLGYCERRTLEFLNYHRFTATSRLVP